MHIHQPGRRIGLAMLVMLMVGPQGMLAQGRGHRFGSKGSAVSPHCYG